MNFRHLIAASAVALLVSTAANQASATDITSLSQPNFNLENGGNWTENYSFGQPSSNFSVVSGSVDLIGGTSPWTVYGNNLYLDMCGSTNQCGSIQTTNSFAAGTYTVTLGLGGIIYPSNNGYGAVNTGVDVNFGGHDAQYLTNYLTQETVSETVTLANAGFLTISDLNLSGNADIGATLLSVNVSAVPLPAALPLFGAALAGLGGLGLRRKAKQAA
jgi:hypothetical protein